MLLIAHIFRDGLKSNPSKILELIQILINPHTPTLFTRISSPSFPPKNQSSFGKLKFLNLDSPELHRKTRQPVLTPVLTPAKKLICPKEIVQRRS